MELVQRNLDLLDTVNEVFAQNGLPTLRPISTNKNRKQKGKTPPASCLFYEML
jgi:hypothetical protein